MAAGGMETAVNCLDTLCKSSSRSTLKQPVMVRAQRHLVTTLLVLGQRSRCASHTQDGECDLFVLSVLICICGQYMMEGLHPND